MDKKKNEKQDDQAETLKENTEIVNEEAEDENEKKIKNLEEQARRYLADYQNLQRRVQEDRIRWIQTANKELLLKLLPVLDTLMLAQKHIDDKGLELSIKQFLDILEKEGVKRIDTVGKKFDPLVMECVDTREGKEWDVLEEVKSGYKIGDIVLRPALVVVGK